MATVTFFEYEGGIRDNTPRTITFRGPLPAMPDCWFHEQGDCPECANEDES